MSRLPALILDKSRHYNAGVTWKASKTHCDHILANFDQETKERFLALPFGSLIRARENIEWSGVLVHNILMHRVHSPYKDELQFVIGSTHSRFGLIEFALITGMNFGEVPSLAEREERRRNQRLKEIYFTEFVNKRINVRDLKLAFEKCEEPVDKFKLGLCYFMEASVFASEVSGEVLLDLLFFVDDIDFFIKYPWGHEAYRRTLEGFTKQDLIKHLEKLDSRKGDPKYTVGGYALALQIWAVECFPDFTPDFAVLQPGPVMFPRMLCWKLSSCLYYNRVHGKFIMKIRGEPFLRPKTEVEHTYLRTIKCSKRLVVELGLDPAQALDESGGNDEAENSTQHSTSSPPRDHQQDCLPATGLMQSVSYVPSPSTIDVLMEALGSFRTDVLAKFEEFGSKFSRIESMQSEIRADIHNLREEVQPILSSRMVYSSGKRSTNLREEVQPILSSLMVYSSGKRSTNLREEVQPILSSRMVYSSGKRSTNLREEVQPVLSSPGPSPKRINHGALP